MVVSNRYMKVIILRQHRIQYKYKITMLRTDVSHSQIDTINYTLITVRQPCCRTVIGIEKYCLALHIPRSSRLCGDQMTCGGGEGVLSALGGVLSALGGVL